MTDQFDANIATLQEKLEELQTHPSIVHCWISALRQQDPEAELAPFADETTMAAAEAQDNIGLENFLEGKIARQWGAIQHDHLLDQQSRRISRTWRAAAVTALLEFLHRMWTRRCDVVHERDEQGLLLARGQSLRESLRLAVEMDPQDLLEADRHLLTNYNIEDLLALSPLEKETWLHAIEHAKNLAAGLIHPEDELSDEENDEYEDADDPGIT